MRVIAASPTYTVSLSSKQRHFTFSMMRCSSSVFAMTFMHQRQFSVFINTSLVGIAAMIGAAAAT